jgi:CubicO group peptidase (beta-lactamase class C family)
MNGSWRQSEYNNVYWSTPRDMARFGLLILNKGKWESQAVLGDQSYFTQMTTTSQSLNPSYGYLWWLNGKESIILPGLAISFDRSLAPDAPEDLFAGAGKNGQFVDIIPSRNMVVVRMGEAPDGSAVPIEFHNEMWKLILNLIGE